MKRVMCTLLIVAILFAGCAGSSPNPVSQYMPGDDNKSCFVLKTELLNIAEQMSQKRLQLAKTHGGNIGWLLGGTLFFPPAWFFMDFKESEKVELEAFERRASMLLIYATEKNCDLGDINSEMFAAGTRQIKVRSTKEEKREARRKLSKLRG